MLFHWQESHLPFFIYPCECTHFNKSGQSIFLQTQFMGLAQTHFTQIWDRASQVEDPFNNNYCLEETERAMTFIPTEHKTHMQSH